MKAQKLVERALRDKPETRSNDRKLIYLVWWLQDRNFTDNFSHFLLNVAIMPETITRHRRKLQEQGKYLATKEVEEERFRKFKEMKETGDPDVL